MLDIGEAEWVAWDDGQVTGTPDERVDAEVALREEWAYATATGPRYARGTPEAALLALRRLWPGAEVLGDAPVIPEQDEDEVIHDDDGDESEQAWRQMVEGGELQEAYDPLLHPRGRTGKWIETFRDRPHLPRVRFPEQVEPPERVIPTAHDVSYPGGVRENVDPKFKRAVEARLAAVDARYRRNSLLWSGDERQDESSEKFKTADELVRRLEAEESRAEAEAGGRVFLMTDGQFHKAEIKLRDLAKRAKKLGLAEPKLIERGEDFQPNPRPEGAEVIKDWQQTAPWGYYRRRYVQVEGEEPKIEGAEFLATLDHLESGANVIRRVPGSDEEQNLDNYRGGDQKCDYCGLKRRRNMTFIVRKDGQIQQVGRECLKDFLGHGDPNAIAAYMERWQELDLLDRGGDDEEREGRGPRYVGTDDFLTHVATMMREDGGYVKRGGSSEYGRRPTADAAMSNMWAYKNRDTDRQGRPLWIEPLPEDEARAAKALEWARTVLAEKPEKSEFEHNVASMVAGGALPERGEGYAAYLITMYERETGREIERERIAKVAAASEHVGTVGERLKLKLKVEQIWEREGNYGTTFITKLADEQGNVFKWFGSYALEQGEEYEGAWQVKKHDEFRGAKETQLTRPTKLEQVALRDAAATGEHIEADAAYFLPFNPVPGGAPLVAGDLVYFPEGDPPGRWRIRGYKRGSKAILEPAPVETGDIVTVPGKPEIGPGTVAHSSLDQMQQFKRAEDIERHKADPWVKVRFEDYEAAKAAFPEAKTWPIILPVGDVKVERESYMQVYRDNPELAKAAGQAQAEKLYPQQTERPISEDAKAALAVMASFPNRGSFTAEFVASQVGDQFATRKWGGVLNALANKGMVIAHKDGFVQRTFYSLPEQAESVEPAYPEQREESRQRPVTKLATNYADAAALMSEVFEERALSTFEGEWDAGKFKEWWDENEGTLRIGPVTYYRYEITDEQNRPLPMVSLGSSVLERVQTQDLKMSVRSDSPTFEQDVYERSRAIAERVAETRLPVIRKRLRGIIQPNAGSEKKAYLQLQEGVDENDANPAWAEFRRKFPHIPDRIIVISEKGYGHYDGVDDVLVTATRRMGENITRVNGLAMMMDRENEEKALAGEPGDLWRRKYRRGDTLKPGVGHATVRSTAALLRHEYAHAIWDALAPEQRDEFVRRLPHDADGGIAWEEIKEGLTSYAGGDEERRAEYEKGYPDSYGYVTETFAEAAALTFDPVYYVPNEWPEWVQSLAEFLRGVEGR